MFERRKIKKLLLNNPKKLKSLKKEAQEYSKHMDDIIKDEDIPNFEEFLAEYGDIAPNFDKNNHSYQVKFKAAKPWYKRLKLVIPVAIASIFSLFVLFTPVGHAFADKIYKTFVQWFDDEVSIHHGTGEAPTDIQEPITEYFVNFEDVQSKLDISIVYNKHADLCEKIELEQNDSLIKIKSIYMINTQRIVVTQTVFEGDTEWSSNIQFNDAQSFDETLDNNIRFIGYVQDGNGYAIAYIDNMKIEIYSENSENIEYDGFVNFIREMNLK